jgi:predicted TIM-barrel fold metal-dependent hydrolase
VAGNGTDGGNDAGRISLDRRTFLTGSLAAAGAMAVARWSPAAGAPAKSAASARVLVDWHSHFVSNAEIKFFSSRREAPRLLTGPDGVTRLENVDTASAAAGHPSEFSASDISARIRHLDKNGIQRQLLTHTVALGLDASLPLDELRPLFRAFNDELAGVVRQHPDRFLGVAALPSADPAWAAQELTRAHHELGFIGGSLPLNAFATLEGARTLAPLFATAQGLGSHFFVHRGPASSLVPGQPPIVIPGDTAYARWTLISNSHLAAGAITLGLTDFLDPYPGVSVQIVMLAGFLPYLIDSVVPAAQNAGIKDPLGKLRRLYVDPGPYSRIGDWVELAASKLGADRILFGSDYGVNGGTRGDIAPALVESQRIRSHSVKPYLGLAGGTPSFVLADNSSRSRYAMNPRFYESERVVLPLSAAVRSLTSFG